MENGKWLSTSFETFLILFIFTLRIFSLLLKLFFPLFLSSTFHFIMKRNISEPPIDINPRKLRKQFFSSSSNLHHLDKRKNEVGIQRVVCVHRTIDPLLRRDTVSSTRKTRSTREDARGFSLSLSHYSRCTNHACNEWGRHAREEVDPSHPGITTWTARKR